jgi:hypothetical protein
MNAEERGRRWRNAIIPEHEALIADEPWPNSMYIDMHGGRFSPLGFLCYLDRPIDGLLARGADPLALGWQKEKRFFNAYQVCAKEYAAKSFAQLMCVTSAEWAKILLQTIVVTDDDGYMCDCDSKFQNMLMEVVERGARFAIGWSLLQMQRDDLIEPVLERLAAIPVEEWTQETALLKARPPVSKKIKII